MDIGEKIKRLRQELSLTQEELANRAELSKSFISQLERNLTSPSITTLTDILECLGTNLKDFFSEDGDEKVVYTEADIFETEDEHRGSKVEWLITAAQRNAMEPILLTLSPGGTGGRDNPHEGEEFGYVLQGSILLIVGNNRYRVKKGDSFYFAARAPHEIQNPGKSTAKVLWVSCPPTF
ncbi:MAG: cupin domain-containing protein [Clostridiales bacterium]|nr:cupin domain-containing protein [Clostridiales bacterium]